MVKNLEKILIATALILSLSSLSFAGGSIRLDIEVEPLLNQKPELKNVLFEMLEIDQDGWTRYRIGNNVNKKFGGKRLGPYHLKAKLKGSPIDYNLELIIHTKRIFLDGNGNPTDLHEAEIIKEEFTSFEIRERSEKCEP